MPNKNPFKASSGTTPPLLVGRDDYIEDFTYALDNGPGTHERITLITGTRGIGKTVLLNHFGDKARERGWFLFEETATPGFVNRLRDQVYQQIRTLGEGSRKTLKALNLNIATLGGVGATFDTLPDHLPNYTLRMALQDLLNFQKQQATNIRQEPSGILITVDELHYNVLAETRDFGAVLQHLTRDNENIAVAVAGIPSSVKPILASKEGENPVTFLRRANRVELDKVSTDEVRRGLVTPLEATDKSWDTVALEIAIDACGGYPFMIQLVGDWCFRYSDTNTITDDVAQKGIAKAQRKLGQLVHEPALNDLSDIDRTYLLHMAQNEGESSTSEIAAKLKKTVQYANTYRTRLLEAQLIHQTRQGYVDFELPYLREYLREHEASLILDYI